jgi:hypothetical protein
MDTTALGMRLREALAGEFELGECLGHGGFAAVFRARDQMLGRDVAIKVLDPDFALAEHTTERFLREARAVAAIEHPHIVPLYEAEMRGGLVFLVMRFLGHGTLAERIATGRPLTPQGAADRAREIAEALAAAHARGVVHRDVKPENVLLDADGRAVVTDFGIALVGAEAHAAEAGRASGTPAYMSPEQVAGDLVDARSDIYALGVVLYEMLSGRLPITGATARQLMANHVSQQPVPLRAIRPELPTALVAVAEQALAKDPARRFPTATAMAAALRAASTAEALLSPRDAQRRTRRRWYARFALIAGGAALVLWGVGVGAVRIVRAYFDPSRAPAINAMSPAIPASLVAELRTAGQVTAADSVLWVFVPHGDSLANALVWTTSALVASSVPGGRRYLHRDDFRIDVNFTGDSGFLVVSSADSTRTDTIFRRLSLRDQTDMLAVLTRLTPRDTSKSAGTR